jgi:CRP-like cAMP-binding protein
MEHPDHLPWLASNAGPSVRRDPAERPPLRSVPEARQNRLLAALPERDWLQWRARLEPVDLPVGRVLYDAGSVPSHAYFPITAVVSLEYLTDSGGSAEIALIGREGVVGVSLFMGDGSTPGRAVVQSAGQALRMPGRLLRDEFNNSATVMRLFLRYTQALISHMAQTAVCNRHHSVDKQLCRWLLISLDRHTSNDLVVTQEQIARMLGVRREGVTEAALSLQRDGLISYRRGHVNVIDRRGLEQRCCECYSVVKAEYDRLLPDPKKS